MNYKRHFTSMNMLILNISLILLYLGHVFLKPTFKKDYEIEHYIYTQLTAPLHTQPNDTINLKNEYEKKCTIRFHYEDFVTFQFISIENLMNEKYIHINLHGQIEPHHLDVLNSLGKHILIVKLKTPAYSPELDLLFSTVGIDKIEIHAISINSQICSALKFAQLSYLVICADKLSFNCLKEILEINCMSIWIKCDNIIDLPSNNTVLICKSPRLVINCRHLERENSQYLHEITVQFQIDSPCLGEIVEYENSEEIYNIQKDSPLDQTQIYRNGFAFECPKNFKLQLTQDISVEHLSLSFPEIVHAGPFFQMIVRKSMTLSLYYMYFFEKLLFSISEVKNFKFELQKYAICSLFDLFELLQYMPQLKTLNIKIHPNDMFDLREEFGHDNLKTIELSSLTELVLESDELIPIFLQNPLIAKTLEICHLRIRSIPLHEISSYLVSFEKLTDLNIKKVEE